jgi:hypothetical protein
MAERDAYLARLDGRIRRLQAEKGTWCSEAGRCGALFGLLAARHLYAHPDDLNLDQRCELAEALAGNLAGHPLAADPPWEMSPEESIRWRTAMLCRAEGHDFLSDRDPGYQPQPGENEECLRGCGQYREARRAD